MKNKKNILAILAIGCMFGIAYMVPLIVTHLEDEHLQSESKKYEIAEININESGLELSEKLTAIQEIVADDIVMQEAIEGEENQDALPEEIMEFAKQICGIQEKKILYAYTTSLLMADSENNRIYPLKSSYTIDADENESTFWMDIETGKVVAFELAYELETPDELNDLAKNLAKYYGFGGGEFAGAVDGFWKSVYYETAIRFYDEEKGEEIMLMFYKNGNRISFNMYPG